MEVRFLLGTKAVASNHRFHPSGDHPPFGLAVQGPEALRPERELMAERQGGSWSYRDSSVGRPARLSPGADVAQLVEQRYRKP